MIYQPEVIGICSDLNFESNYVPFVSFKSQEQKDAAEDYIIHQVNYFFKNILNIDSVEQLPYPKIITENDFKSVDIKYFYDNLFYDLGERNSEGKLEPKIKWGITFDEKCAPIKVVMANPRNDSNQNKINQNRRYGTIDINGTPIFYYIYFTLQEILDVIKL